LTDGRAACVGFFTGRVLMIIQKCDILTADNFAPFYLIIFLTFKKLFLKRKIIEK